MSVNQLLSDVAAAGVTLYLDGDQLRFRARPGALTTDLRTGITRFRGEIVQKLRPQVEGRGATARCSYCDPKEWIDEPPCDGQIRTTCGKCGRFVGYRPVAT